MDNQEKTTVFMEFATVGQAAIIEGLLNANDIPCFIGNQFSMYNVGLMSDVSSVRLYVFERDLDKARTLVEKTEIDFGVEDDELLEGYLEDIPEEFRDDGKDD